MRRRLFNLAAAVSLVLCGVMLILWLALLGLWVDTRLLGNVRRLCDRPIYAANGVSVHGRVAILCWKDGFRVKVGEDKAFAGMGTKFDHWMIPGASLERMSGRSRLRGTDQSLARNVSAGASDRRLPDMDDEMAALAQACGRIV